MEPSRNDPYISTCVLLAILLLGGVVSTVSIVAPAPTPAAAIAEIIKDRECKHYFTHEHTQVWLCERASK